MDSIALYDKLTKLNDSDFVYQIKSISKDEISYYATRLIDTSNIDLIDFGEKF